MITQRELNAGWFAQEYDALKRVPPILRDDEWGDAVADALGRADCTGFPDFVELFSGLLERPLEVPA